MASDLILHILHKFESWIFFVLFILFIERFKSGKITLLEVIQSQTIMLKHTEVCLDNGVSMVPDVLNDLQSPPKLSELSTTSRAQRIYPRGDAGQLLVTFTNFFYAVKNFLIGHFKTSTLTQAHALC